MFTVSILSEESSLLSALFSIIDFIDPYSTKLPRLFSPEKTIEPTTLLDVIPLTEVLDNSILGPTPLLEIVKPPPEPALIDKVSGTTDELIPTLFKPPSTNNKWVLPLPATLKSLSLKF